MVIKTYSFTIDCPNPKELAAFYAKLLNWNVVFSDAEYACIGAPETPQGGYAGITFQYNPDYKPPVWPDKAGEQQQMAHLDFAVDNIEESVSYAVSLGAVQAKEQFSDAWRVMLDPVGHPFCLIGMKELLSSENCKLK